MQFTICRMRWWCTWNCANNMQPCNRNSLDSICNVWILGLECECVWVCVYFAQRTTYNVHCSYFIPHSINTINLFVLLLCTAQIDLCCYYYLWILCCCLLLAVVNVQCWNCLLRLLFTMQNCLVNDLQRKMVKWNALNSE